MTAPRGPGEAQPGQAGGAAERPPGQLAEARAERGQHHHGADLAITRVNPKCTTGH